MKRRLQALLVLLLLGALKLPMEQRVSARLKEARLLSDMVDLGMAENLGQMGFAASLGGLRSLVAGITYMRAYIAFEDIEWARVDSLFQITCRLQPRDVSYWDEASWHMAFNAASSYLHGGQVEPIMRGQLYHAHIARGIQILEEGLRFNPGQVRLLARLGDIYARRTLEPLKAAQTYERVVEAGGPAHFRRMAGYEYLKAPERDSWQRSYRLLKESYDRGERFPSVIDGLKELEQRLDIPPAQRIPETGSGRSPGANQPVLPPR